MDGWVRICLRNYIGNDRNNKGTMDGRLLRGLGIVDYIERVTVTRDQSTF